MHLYLLKYLLKFTHIQHHVQHFKLIRHFELIGHLELIVVLQRQMFTQSQAPMLLHLQPLKLRSDKYTPTRKSCSKNVVRMHWIRDLNLKLKSHVHKDMRLDVWMIAVRGVSVQLGSKV